MYLSRASIAHRLWCQKRRSSALRLFPFTLFALAAAAFATPQAPNNIHRVDLTPADEAVVNAPFAPPDARPHLRSYIAALEARRTARLLLPKTTLDPPNPSSMGWSMTDQDYWKGIPDPAKAIPDDWAQLPVVRYTNSQLGGLREVRLAAGPEYDQWLLSDPTHKLSACISVQRSTHRVFFMEIARNTSPGDKGKWVFHPGFDNCYSCHPSGPRAIRPLQEQGVDLSALANFNRRILAYHACAFGDEVGANQRAQPVNDSACSGCHNGTERSKLYGIHAKTIEFKKTDECTMPVG